MGSPPEGTRCPACDRDIREIRGEAPIAVQVDGVWGCSSCYDAGLWPTRTKIKPPRHPGCSKNGRADGTLESMAGVASFLYSPDGDLDGYNGHTTVWWDGQYSEFDSQGHLLLVCGACGDTFPDADGNVARALGLAALKMETPSTRAPLHREPVMCARYRIGWGSPFGRRFYDHHEHVDLGMAIRSIRRMEGEYPSLNHWIEQSLDDGVTWTVVFPEERPRWFIEHVTAIASCIEAAREAMRRMPTKAREPLVTALNELEKRLHDAASPRGGGHVSSS